MQIVIPCYVRPRTARNGNAYNAYYTQFNDEGQVKNLPLRFTRDVKNTPDENCNIVVNEDDASIGFDSRGRECVWVRAIVKETAMKRQGKKLSTMFVAYDDDGENPFEGK